MPGAQGRRVQELDPHHALKDLQDRGVVRVGVDRCISTAICSRQPKRAHKIRTVLIPTDGAEKSGHFPFTPETRSPTVMENLFCPPLYGLWGHGGSRSTGLWHRKGQHGRSSSGCKSALPLPERTMPAQFTPAEDLIGIWLWLQN